MLLRNIFVKLVAPATLAGSAVGGGGYFVAQYLFPVSEIQEGQEPKTNSQISNQIGVTEESTLVAKQSPQPEALAKGSFEVFLSSEGGRKEVLKCKSPQLSDNQHYNISLWKKSDDSAELTCGLSDSPQPGITLRIKDPERKDEEDLEASGSISGLECTTFEGEGAKVFTCTFRGSEGINMKLEETQAESKIVFVVNKESNT
ncbi:hypothetical protein MHLP_00860 [Candidatus Mycoplasma haematolamae str. Purdue]|uniref:Uncharacterized protein n=1 Tax=Mycoplasma haematolamae (strain Purdue) TaxID=1212765 RepID=I7C5G8_MYCHA|nr:hypothetical protein [Candidatus Mycoplasma haematolamae]AFO51752.1 hypothetical protein MHLP_00860 [Candidatus Mycoplasma haematolamae str. Purdue]